MAHARGHHPGNGTFAFPAIYTGLLAHLASHGFVVVAANTSNAGVRRGRRFIRTHEEALIWLRD